MDTLKTLLILLFAASPAFASGPFPVYTPDESTTSMRYNLTSADPALSNSGWACPNGAAYLDQATDFAGNIVTCPLGTSTIGECTTVATLSPGGTVTWSSAAPVFKVATTTQETSGTSVVTIVCSSSSGGGGGTDDQTASEVPFAPAGTIASGTVQLAIEEVAAEAGGLDAADQAKLDAIQYYYADAYLAANPVSTTFGIEEARAACEATDGGVVHLWSSGTKTIAYSNGLIGDFLKCSLQGYGAISSEPGDADPVSGPSVVSFTNVSTESPFRFTGNGLFVENIGCLVDQTLQASPGCVSAGVGGAINTFRFENNALDSADTAATTGTGLTLGSNAGCSGAGCSDGVLKSIIRNNSIKRFYKGITIEGNSSSTRFEANSIRINAFGLVFEPAHQGRNTWMSENQFESNIVGVQIEAATQGFMHLLMDRDALEPPGTIGTVGTRKHIVNNSTNANVIATGIRCSNSGGTLMDTDACYTRTATTAGNIYQIDRFTESNLITGMALEDADARLSLGDTNSVQNGATFTKTAGAIIYGGEYTLAAADSAGCQSALITDHPSFAGDSCFPVDGSPAWQCSSPDAGGAASICDDALDIAMLDTGLSPITNLDCTTVPTVAVVPAASGIYNIPSSAGCAEGNFIALNDPGTLDPLNVNTRTVINRSGVTLTVINGSGHTIQFQSGSIYAPDSSTFSVIQYADNTSDIVGTGFAAGVYNVLDYGAIRGDGLEDHTAINAAVAAAGAAGGGTVLFPDGIYHVGVAGSGRFYSGVQVTEDNIVLKAETKHAAEIRPLFTHGGVMISACPAFDNTGAYGANNDCGSAPNLEGFTIDGLFFHDPTPTLTCLDYGEGGFCGATFGTKGEESHGTFTRGINDLEIKNNRFLTIGDEGIDNSADGAWIHHNLIEGTPAIRSAGGSSIAHDGSDAIIENNVIRGILRDPAGDGDGVCTNTAETVVEPCTNNGKAIDIATNRLLPNFRNIVRFNHMTEIGSQVAISLNSNNGSNRGVRFEGNVIEMTDSDTIPCNPTTVVSRCTFAASGTVGAPARDSIVFLNNKMNAGIDIIPTGGNGLVEISGNELNGTIGRGLRVTGNPLRISRNVIRGFSEHPLMLVGMDVDLCTDTTPADGLCDADDCTDANSDELCDADTSVSVTHYPVAVMGSANVLVEGNSFVGNHTDGTAEPTISMFGSSCGSDGVLTGGVKILGNDMFGPDVAGSSMGNGISLSACTQYVANDNRIDYNGSSSGAAVGIFEPKQASNNTVIDAVNYGIYTTVNRSIISGNTLKDIGNRSIYGNTSDFSTVQGNVITNPGFHAIDMSGQSPICLGNIVANTDSATVRSIFCGTATGGAGCGVDVAANGLCDFNQNCVQGDTGCAP